MKRICFVSCVGDVNDSHTIKYIKTLVKHNFPAAAIRPGKLQESLEPEGSFLHIELPKITQNFWPTGNSLGQVLQGLLQRAVNSIRLARKLIKLKPAVIVATEPDAWFISVIINPLVKARIVADMREVYEDRLLGFPKPLQKPGTSFLKAIMKWLSRYTAEVIHMSEERKQVYTYLEKKGKVVAYYPDHATFSAARPSTQQRGSTFILIHAGSLREKYGANELIKALEVLHNQQVSFRMQVPGGISGKIAELDTLKKLEAAGVIELLAPMPYNQVLELFRDAHIGINLVLPTDQSHFLAQPRKLYEYIGAGLPFVAADVPTIARVARKWECGKVVDPYNPEEIAAAINFFAQNESARLAASRKAIEAFNAEYNWESQEPRFIQIFDELLKTKK